MRMIARPAHNLQPSCPGLSRASTSVSLPESLKPRPDMDGRDKPGHDDRGRRAGGAHRQWFAVLALALGTASLPGISRAAEPPWPDTPYPYVVIDQDLVQLLTEFGRNMGTPVQVSDQVHGRVLGKQPPLAPRAFIDRLATEYSFSWYYDGTNLAISANSEMVQRMVPLGTADFDKLSADLDRLGVTDSRHQLHHVQGAEAVMVTGPPRFVELVDQTISAMNREHTPSTVKLYLGDTVNVGLSKPTVTVPVPKTAESPN